MGLLFYGYATGVFSSRAIERATYESIPFRFLAGNLHPDHDTIAYFRTRFLTQIKELFVQVLCFGVQAGVLTLTDLSIDGTKIHADASKSKAVSHKRLLELQAQLCGEVEELLRLSEQADGAMVPPELDIEAEIVRRQHKLDNLAHAQGVLQARAKERYEMEQGQYEVLMAERAAKAQQTGRNPRGRVPKPPL